MAEPHGQLMRYKKRRPKAVSFFALAGAGWGVSCPGTSNLAVHNFRQPNQRFGASVVFFCKKKVTKENHSNLRSKNPLARGGFRRPGGESVSP